MNDANHQQNVLVEITNGVVQFNGGTPQVMAMGKPSTSGDSAAPSFGQGPLYPWVPSSPTHIVDG